MNTRTLPALAVTLSVALALLASAPAAGAQAPCTPGWLATFVDGDGIPAFVHALEVYDDGSGGGPRLYAGGSFATAGGVTANGIA